MFGPGKVYPGGLVRVKANFVNTSGIAADPTTVTFRLMTPCGSEYSYVYGTNSELTKVSTGLYQMLVPSTVTDHGGRYRYRWETTGATTTTASEGSFTIQASVFFDDCCSDYGASN